MLSAVRHLVALGLITMVAGQTEVCVETRTRDCNLATDLMCENMGHELIETRPCTPDMCTPVDCVQGPWADSTGCVLSTKTQTRSVTTMPDCEGAACGDDSREVSCTDASCSDCTCFVLNADTLGVVPNVNLVLLPGSSWNAFQSNQVLRYSSDMVSGNMFISIRMNYGGQVAGCLRRVTAEVRCFRSITMGTIDRSGNRVNYSPQVTAATPQTDFQPFVWTSEGSTNVAGGCVTNLSTAQLRISHDNRSPCDVTMMAVRNVEFYSCSAVSLDRNGNVE